MTRTTDGYAFVLSDDVRALAQRIKASSHNGVFALSSLGLEEGNEPTSLEDKALLAILAHAVLKEHGIEGPTPHDIFANEHLGRELHGIPLLIVLSFHTAPEGKIDSLLSTTHRWSVAFGVHPETGDVGMNILADPFELATA